MRAILVGCAVLALSGGGAAAKGSHAVSSYVRSNGTVVAAHRQTNPNKTKLDNWSTKGNVNPMTGQTGTKKAR